MKKLLHICVVTCVSCLLMPAAGMAGKGYMGGSGTVSVTEEPVAGHPRTATAVCRTPSRGHPPTTKWPIPANCSATSM